MAELRGLGVANQAIEKHGGRIAAVSVDDASDSLNVVRRNKLGFPILVDRGAEVIRRYDILHAGAGPDGQDLAIPAHFLIDRDGRIVWRWLAERVQDRPAPEDIVAQIEQLPAAP